MTPCRACGLLSAGRMGKERKREDPAAQAPTAVPPGLVWVNDRMPGIRRRRRGQGFVYLDSDGRPVRDAATLQRIRRLAVPPAYAAVWICPLPQGHLQATGRDARGRKQYRYHADWQAERGATKFDRLAAVGEALARVRRRVRADLAAGTQPSRRVVLATLVRLLDTTCLRVGNEAYARENGSFGLTTLRTRHAGVHGSEIRLCFRGKGGVQQQLRLDDARIARVVRRCRELPGQELFQYQDESGALHRIGSAEVNEYLAETAGERLTAKDFRTWHASVQALALLLAEAAAGPDAAAPGGPAPLTTLVATVARRLGNTPAICRKSYIHPAVLALGDALATPEGRARLLAQRWAAAPPRGPPGLQRAERQMLGLLRRLRRGGGPFPGTALAPAAATTQGKGRGHGQG